MFYFFFKAKNGQHFEVKIFSCMFNQEVNEAYITFIILLIFFALGLLLPFFYYKIFKKVTISRSRSLGHDYFRKNELEQIHKTTKGIYYSFLFFSCSFVPYFILILIKNYQNFLPRFIYLYMFLMVRSNSVFNPILYGTTNSHFKKSFSHFFDYLSCKKPTVYHASNETAKFSKECGGNCEIDVQNS